MAPPASGHARVTSSPAPLPAAELSLGEVARRVRAERAQRRPQRAAVAPPRVRVQQPVRNAPRVTRQAPPATLPAPAHSRPQQQECVPSENAICVRRGDSLWKLAREHLGAGARWTELWQANPEISDPDLILPGQSLRTPAQMQAPPAGGPVVAALQAPCTVPVQAFSPWDPFWTAPAATSLL
jgi:nucleoid-associated protein YgaU